MIEETPTPKLIKPPNLGKHRRVAPEVSSIEWISSPGVGYQLRIQSFGVQCDLLRIRRDHHETIGLLTVRAKFAGARRIQDDIISSADFNCSSVRARSERAKLLADKCRTDEIDWLTVLEDLCFRVLAAEDEGEPYCALQDVPLTGESDISFDAAGLPLVKRHPTIWFGDGGCGKSYLALYAAVAVVQDGGRALYLDWEFSGEDHRHRLHRLVGPIPSMPGLIYRRCQMPLVYDIDRVREIVTKERITFLICDSLGYAAPEVEKSESATSYRRALNLLPPITSLHLAHVTKSNDDQKNRNDQKPFGSQFWHNTARSTWYLKRTDAEDSDDMGIGMWHRKTNTGRLMKPRGFLLNFIGTQTIIRASQTPLETPELSRKLSVPDRMKLELKTGSMTTKELAESLGVSTNEVRSIVSRYKAFTRIGGKDGPIGLLDGHSSDE